MAFKKWNLIFIVFLVVLGFKAQAEEFSFHPWYVLTKATQKPSALLTGLGVASYVNPLCEKMVRRCPNEEFKVSKCLIAVRDYFRAAGKLNSLNKKGRYIGNTQYFREETKELNKDPDALGFLKDLENRLQNPRSFNLWSYAISNRNIKDDPNMGAKSKAIKFLAVLFQRAHVATPILDPEVGHRIHRINRILDKRIANGTVQAYPPPIDIKNRGIYHFYANAYIFRKMWFEKGVPLKYAAAGTWSLNQAYEEHKNKTHGTEAMANDIFTGFAAVDFVTSDSIKRYDGPKRAKVLQAIKRKDLSYVDEFIESIPNFCNDGWAPRDPKTIIWPGTQPVQRPSGSKN